MSMILRTHDSVDDFYEEANNSINKILGSKLRILGVEVRDIPTLIDNYELARYTSDIVDGIILWMYEYKGIRLIEVEWSIDGIKLRDINKDERTFKRDI